MGFSVNALFYGDHTPLAARLLKGFLATADWSLIDDVRFAFNAVAEKTRQCVTAVADSLPVPCHIYEERNGRNVGKYPLVRRMFYDPVRPITSSRIMWFDDDTYFRDGTNSDWWLRVWTLAQKHVLVGSRYRMLTRGNQYMAVPLQPWYTGKAFSKKQRFIFCTGGWWVADAAVLRKWDYPFPELHHNGGDTMLGEVIRQQGYSLCHFNDGIAINADAAGKESKSERRGIESRWIWQDYEPGKPVDLSHQQFEVKVTSYGPASTALPLTPPEMIRLNI